MRQHLFASLALLLAVRPAFADTLATGAVADTLSLDDEFITNLKESTAMAFLPDGRIIVTERAGNVRLFDADGKDLGSMGTFTASTAFGEKGLLNVAVHPDFATNRTLFFYYTGKGAVAGEDDNRVVSIKVGTDDKLDMASEKKFVSGISAPLNHNGGGLAVLGKYLFIGTGDSGSNSNAKPYDQKVTNYYATCLSNLNGKLLRLNLDGSIPTDNPLVGKMVPQCGSKTGTEPSGMGAARTEIFAWGFRNAFRVWGDPETSNLWVGHVGEVTFEMINVVPPTGNQHFGWPFREGGQGFPATQCKGYTPDKTDCVDPVYFCEQSDGKDSPTDKCPDKAWAKNCDNPDVPNDCDSMTGGLILSGCEWPAALRGKFIFGDYTNKRIWTLPINTERNNATGERVDFATSTGGPAQFVEHEGALYVVQFSGAKSYIAKITPKMTPADCAGTPPAMSMSMPPVGSSDAGGGMMGGTTPTASATATGGGTPTATGTATAGGGMMGGGTVPTSTASIASPAEPQPSGSVKPSSSAAGTATTTGGGDVTPPAASSAAATPGKDAASCGCDVVGRRQNRSLASLTLGLLGLGWAARRQRRAVR